MSVKSKHSPYIQVHALIIAAAAVMIFSITLFFSSDDKINQANLDYISSLGWQVAEKPVDIAYITIPAEFDGVFTAYNNIVKSGGFDLAQYAGTNAVRYSYSVLNYPDSKNGSVRINIIVHRSKIISADLSSVAEERFVLPLTQSDR